MHRRWRREAGGVPLRARVAARLEEAANMVKSGGNVLSSSRPGTRRARQQWRKFEGKIEISRGISARGDVVVMVFWW